MTTTDNLSFTAKPIDAASIRLADGPNVRIAIGTIQRVAALRAYAAYGSACDWMDKLSSVYIVALATRSADALLMRHIKEDLNERLSISCRNCRNASIGEALSRERLFPELKRLREYANDLVHHLDDPDHRGIADLNVEGVFDYCHHLFQENIDALFGTIPDPRGKFPLVKCKKCKQRAVR